MEIKICTNEVLLNLLFRLMGKSFRRFVFEEEIENYKNYIIELCKSQNINVIFVEDVTERLRFIQSVIDRIVVNGKTLYRLKSSVISEDIWNLARLNQYYKLQHPTVDIEPNISFLHNTSFYSTLDENNFEEFRKIDSSQELELLNQLFELVLKQRELEARLNMLRQNGISMFTDIQEALEKTSSLSLIELEEPIKR